MGYDSPRIPKNLKVSLGFLQVIVVICGHMYYQVQTTVVWGVRKEPLVPSYLLIFYISTTTATGGPGPSTKIPDAHMRLVYFIQYIRHISYTNRHLPSISKYSR